MKSHKNLNVQTKFTITFISNIARNTRIVQGGGYWRYLTRKARKGDKFSVANLPLALIAARCS